MAFSCALRFASAAAANDPSPVGATAEDVPGAPPMMADLEEPGWIGAVVGLRAAPFCAASCFVKRILTGSKLANICSSRRCTDSSFSFAGVNCDNCEASASMAAEKFSPPVVVVVAADCAVVLSPADVAELLCSNCAVALVSSSLSFFSLIIPSVICLIVSSKCNIKPCNFSLRSLDPAASGLF